VTLPSPSTPVLICLAVCGFILIFAGIDLAHTTTRLADFPSRDCRPDEASCFNAQLSESTARERAAEPLQREYDSRTWLYAFAFLATAAVATAWSMRVNPRTEWLRIFTNLGVIGVWLGIAVTVTLVATDGNALAPAAAPMLMLPVVLLVAAVAGTMIGRSEGWAERSQADELRDRVLHLGKLAIHIGTVGQVKRSRMEELAGWLATVDGSDRCRRSRRSGRRGRRRDRRPRPAQVDRGPDQPGRLPRRAPSPPGEHLHVLVMEPAGLEPATFALQTRRSPN
jgi:hypothetical protein